MSQDRTTSDQQAQGMTPTDVLDVLEELAGLIENARPLLMSSDVRVDRDQALGLVDELRGGLPGAIERADTMHAQAAAELEEARRSAEDTIVQARQRAMELVEHEQVVAQAKARAAEIVAEAQQQADRLRADADDYCDRRLADFERDLEGLVGQVRAGRAKLAERLEPAPAQRLRRDRDATD
jgi:cell division septum initiation protein DivIVA